MASPMRVTMGQHGRLQLPEELLLSKGWRNQQWLEIVELPDGIALRPVEPPAAVEVIKQILSANLSPLGAGRGETNNKYVDRWRHKFGAVVVCETSQPNVWLLRDEFDRFDVGVVPGVVEYFSPGTSLPGFHSNVASTPGLKGRDVAKIRARDPTEAKALALAIVHQLGKLP